MFDDRWRLRKAGGRGRMSGTGRPRAPRAGAIALCALVLAATALGGCARSSGSDKVTLSGEELVATRCHSCHDSTRIDAAVHDRAAWERTIDRMIAKGTKLNDAEKAAVLEYLANR